jgi:hypothetical protein
MNPHALEVAVIDTDKNKGLSLVAGRRKPSTLRIPRFLGHQTDSFPGIRKPQKTVQDNPGAIYNLGKAGGILIFQDDHTLLRFAAGSLFDGEISLAVKPPELGFDVPGRGLLDQERLALRIARRGNIFGAWCGAGGDWFRCAETELAMKETIQAGIFAECTYRTLRVERCMATPLKFRRCK